MDYSSLDVEDTPIILITVGENRRPLDEGAVTKLMESIKQIGLQTPITLREVPFDENSADLFLVTGRHRLEAAKRLGWETIPAISHTDWDEIDAELWEISENLHRAELTALQRSEQIARYLELSKAKADRLVGQVAPQEPGHGKGAQGGTRAAAREIGVEHKAARRAEQIASLTPEAKAAAQETGLDDNQSVLLEASKRAPEDQASFLRDERERRERRFRDQMSRQSDRKQQRWASIISLWHQLDEDQQADFRDYIDTPVFDRTAANA